MDESVALGRVMRRLRGTRTQKEVAAAADINPSSWSLYEGAKRRAKKETWERIARGLGLTLRELEELVLAERQEAVREASESTARQRPLPEPHRLLVAEFEDGVDAIASHLKRIFRAVMEFQDPPAG